MLHIVRSVRAGNNVPTRFQRPRRQRHNEPPVDRNVRARRGRPRAVRGQAADRGEVLGRRPGRRGRPRGSRGRGRGRNARQ